MDVFPVPRTVFGAGLPGLPVAGSSMIVLPSGTLSAVSQVVSLTKRTAVVRIEVKNGERLVCAAQGTVLIMAPKGS